jgi:MFS family permease
MSIQSSYGIGCILGMLTIPLLADLKGKRLATNISLFCIVLSSIILYFGISNQSHIFIALGIMMSGIGASGMAPISYAINSDFFSDNLRQKALIYYCAAWYSIFLY